MGLLKTFAIVLGSLVLAAVAFWVTTAAWGSWWRIPNFPEPEEWSAFWGVSALAALFIAWRQIRQVDQSNRSLVDSNRETQRINLEQVRPRVDVALIADRSVFRTRGGPVQGTLYLAVENVGRSAAHDVRLTVDRPFESLPEFFLPDKYEAHLAELAEAFNGAVRFPTLRVGQQYIWFLGRVPRLFEAENITRKYEFRMQYRDALGHEFDENSMIDLDVEKRIALPVEPLVRIGKDLEVIGEKLNNISGNTRDLVREYERRGSESKNSDYLHGSRYRGQRHSRLRSTRGQG